MVELEFAMRDGAYALETCNYIDAELHFKRASECGNSRAKAIYDKLVSTRKKNSAMYYTGGIERVSCVSRVRTRYSTRIDSDEFKADNCVVCLTFFPSITILPCNHRALCLDCSTKVIQENNMCVLCKGDIVSVRVWD